MKINLNPTSESAASRDAVNRPRETLGDSHLISSDPRSRFGLVCDLLCCRGNTIFPFHPVFAVQETHPVDPISMLCRRIAGATALSCAEIWVSEGGLELWESGGLGEFNPDAAAERHNLD